MGLGRSREIFIWERERKREREREREKELESQKLSKWGVVKLVRSRKFESGIDKGDVRDKKGRQKKKKNTMKHERGIVILLTFEFE